VRANETTSAGSLAVVAGLTLPGSVRDDVGGRIAGVRITLSPEAVFEGTRGLVLTATSDADGAFVFHGVKAGAKLAWGARKTAFAIERGVWGGESRLEINMDRAQTIVGLVRNPDGEPLAGASVDITYRPKPGAFQGGIPPVQSDAEGRFEITREDPHPLT